MYRFILQKISILFVPILAVGFLLLAYNYAFFQNLFAFPEDYWIGYDGQAVSSLSQFSTPLWTGLQGLLISSSRGLFLFSPIVLLALPGFYLLAKTWKWEALLFASVFLGDLLTYSAWDLWNGGASFGPGFLVPAIPFLVIPLFAFVEFALLSCSAIVKWGGTFLIVALFIFSVGVESIGAITSATAPFNNSPFFQFLIKYHGISKYTEGKFESSRFCFADRRQFDRISIGVCILDFVGWDLDGDIGGFTLGPCQSSSELCD